jgi:hypothetical protein
MASMDTWMYGDQLFACHVPNCIIMSWPCPCVWIDLDSCVLRWIVSFYIIFHMDIFIGINLALGLGRIIIIIH